MTVRRRSFLAAAVASASLGKAVGNRHSFKTGVVPAGRSTVADSVGAYWEHCKEVSGLGFHQIEINNTRARIAEAYLDRTTEFKDRMSALNLKLVGMALFSHAADSSKRAEVRAIYRRLASFLSAVGGTYITHMIAPAAELNESNNATDYQQVDLKAWSETANEVGKSLANDFDVHLAYHPEKEEVRTALYQQFLEATDDRYVRFLPDTGHLAAAGADVATECKRYASRLACVHLKDFSPTPQGDKPIKGGNVPLGQGIVNLEEVVSTLGKSSFSGYVMAESGGSNLWMRDYLCHELRLVI